MYLWFDPYTFILSFKVKYICIERLLKKKTDEPSLENTLFENESITDINYPALFLTFPHSYIMGTT